MTKYFWLVFDEEGKNCGYFLYHEKTLAEKWVKDHNGSMKLQKFRF